jgi:putative transposase
VRWVAAFVQWYNHVHQHSAIRFVTPADRHAGREHAILAHRDAVYADARARHPTRRSGGTRDWTPVAAVRLNPDQEVELPPQIDAA